MKELSIEEKAKAYDEAIERAKNYYSTTDSASDIKLIGLIFPELKESEDEMMVKFIKNQLFNIKKTITENYELDAKLTKAIDWLEKQGKNNMGISEATKKKLEDNLNKALEKETPESCNEFLDEQGEQKPAWSEEDNRMCKAIIDNIQAICEEGYFVGNIDSNELIKWLKSLKERYTWKPRDEQMDALYYVTNFDYGGHKATLVSLYEQLKKLREEDV